MSTIANRSNQHRISLLAVGLLFSAGTALAQDAPANTTQPPDSSSQNGWKRFNGGWSNQNAASPRAGTPAPTPTTAVQVTRDAPPSISPDSTTPPANLPAIRPDRGAQETSSRLTIQPGTILIVRMNQALSSDHNQVGDVFSATLTQPVVVHGIVVAQRGQTVAGRVVEAKKAGMVSGVSHLGIALTSLTLADGQTVPIESQLLVRKGPTSVGRDAAAIAGTTALGAGIGAAADWGRGAAIGAGAGAAAGVLGVLLTRGYPTIVYPESQLTFQTMAPVPIDTDYAPQAFRAVDPADYPQSSAPQQAPAPQAPAAAPPPAYPYPYPYYVYGPPYNPYDYPYYGYPYYGYYGGYPFFGSSFFFFGHGHDHFHGFHGGGFHGGGFHGGGFHGGRR